MSKRAYILGLYSFCRELGVFQIRGKGLIRYLEPLNPAGIVTGLAAPMHWKRCGEASSEVFAGPMSQKRGFTITLTLRV